MVDRRKETKFQSKEIGKQIEEKQRHRLKENKFQNEEIGKQIEEKRRIN